VAEGLGWAEGRIQWKLVQEEQLEVCQMLYKRDGVVISKGRLELEGEAIQRGHRLPKVGMTVT